MGTALAPLTKEQQKIFEAMPKALQEIATKACEITQRIVRNEIMGRFALGELVKRVTKDERRYGEAAVPSLAAYLGGDVSDTQLWSYRRFATVYSRQDVEKMMVRPMINGKRITWSHFEVLSGLSGAKALQQRRELEKAVVEEGLSVAELAAAVKEQLGTRGHSTGRKPRIPKSIGAGLGQIAKYAADINRRNAGWIQAVYVAIKKAGSDELTEKTLASLKDTQKAEERLLDQVDNHLEKLDEAITRTEKILTARKGAAAARKKAVKKPAKKVAKKAKKAVVKKAAVRKAVKKAREKPAIKRKDKKPPVKKKSKRPPAKKVGKKKGAAQVPPRGPAKKKGAISSRSAAERIASARKKATQRPRST